MSVIKKLNKLEIWYFFMNDQNIFLGYTPLLKS